MGGEPGHSARDANCEWRLNDTVRLDCGELLRYANNRHCYSAQQTDYPYATARAPELPCCEHPSIFGSRSVSRCRTKVTALGVHIVPSDGIGQTFGVGASAMNRCSRALNRAPASRPSRLGREIVRGPARARRPGGACPPLSPVETPQATVPRSSRGPRRICSRDYADHCPGPWACPSAVPATLAVCG